MISLCALSHTSLFSPRFSSNDFFIIFPLIFLFLSSRCSAEALTLIEQLKDQWLMLSWAVTQRWNHSWLYFEYICVKNIWNKQTCLHVYIFHICMHIAAFASESVWGREWNSTCKKKKKVESCLLIVLLCMLSFCTHCSFCLFSSSLINRWDSRKAAYAGFPAWYTGGFTTHSAHSGRLDF